MAKSSEIVNRFYDAWNKKDIGAMEKLLADYTRYEGPLVTWEGKKQYVEGAKQIMPAFNGIKVLKQFEDRDTVCSIIEIQLNTPDGPVTCNVSELTKVSDGRIAESRTFYDPRKIEKYFAQR